LDDLVEQYINQVPSGLLVGKDMLDIDHEQLQIGMVDANDPQTLDNPRPDQTQLQSRALYSWRPVGLNMPAMVSAVGRVKVVIS
jgi:hypothetical protein